MTDVQNSYEGQGSSGGAPRRPVGLLGLIAILVLIIILLLALLLRGCDDSGGGDPAPTVEVTREVTQEVTRLVTVEGGGGVVEVTRLVTQEVPGPEVTRVVTQIVSEPGPEVTRMVTQEVPVTRVVTETVEIPRIVTRVVVIPPPPPQDTGDGCTRFNLETGRNRETGIPSAGTFVMIQEPFDRDDDVVAVWHAAAGARDSGWLRDLPLAREAVHVQVYFYPDNFGMLILLEIVNPAPDTTYGWLARGVCHSIEVQFPEEG